MNYRFFTILVLSNVFLLNCNIEKTSSEKDVRINYVGFQLPQKEPIIFAPNIISLQGFNEYGGHFSPDGKEFYFTRFKPGDPAVIMFSANINEEWSTPDTLSFMQEYPGSESCFSPDGNKFFYVHFDEHDGEFTSDFFNVNRTDFGWEIPKSITDIDLGERQISPSVSDNFNLYFSGSLNEPNDKDIFVSFYKDSNYTSPLNLGSNVNSDYYEEHVYVSPDESYILFDSYRSDGIGSSDIYISFRKSDGSWTEAQNLGEPINSEYYDWYPNVTPDGKYLIFARTIERKIDLYWCKAEIINRIKGSEL